MQPSDRAFFGAASRCLVASLAAALGLAGCASSQARPPAAPPPRVAAPGPATSIYTVQRGDTLSEIARRHGVPAGEIAQANRLADPHRLTPGQLLVIPTEAPATAAATARKTVARRTNGAAAPRPPAVSSAPPSYSSSESDALMTPVARAAARSDYEFVCVDAWIDEGQSYLRGARYEEAIESAQKARAALERLGDGGAVSSRAARLEILSGSAEVALGRGSDAESSFTRALEADPSLRLDAAWVSPKVVRAFEETRKGIAPPAAVAGAPRRPQFGDDVASDGSTTARPAGD